MLLGWRGTYVHRCLTMATTDSVQLVLMVQLLRWMAAHLQEKLPRSSTTTFFGWAKATRCLYRPYQSLMNGPGSCCGRVFGGGGGLESHTVLPAKRVHFGFFEKIVYNFKQTSSMFKIS